MAKYCSFECGLFCLESSLQQSPNTSELAHLGVVLRSQTLCKICHCKEETESHMFFERTVASQVWMECLWWCGINSALQSNRKCHFLQFGGPVICGKNSRLWQEIWFTVIWSIWSLRNQWIFKEVKVEGRATSGKYKDQVMVMDKCKM